MAHAFDNRNFTHEKQQNHSLSFRSNQLPSSYEDTYHHRNGNSRTGKRFFLEKLSRHVTMKFSGSR